MNTSFDPFEIDESSSFIDALLIQFVSDPSRLRFSHRSGGFFVEADAAPAGEFAPAVLVTRDGREVAGFAAVRLRVFPVALRSRWEVGEPGARRAMPGYQPGARSHTQVLAVLPGGAWVVITARGLASKALARAFRDHARFVAARLRSAAGRPYAPFAAVLELAAGKPTRAGSSVITPLERVIPDRPEPAPVELGRAVRRRWAEVQAWQGEWAGEAIPNGSSHPGPEPVPAEEEPAGAPAEALAAPTAPAGDVTGMTPAGAPESEPAPEAALEQEAALAFLLGQAWELARPRLIRAFPDLAGADTPGQMAARLARARPGAAFWGHMARAMELFEAWKGRVEALSSAAPVQYRALKEHLRVGAAWGQNTDDPRELAAMAALTWLFRPGERALLEQILGPAEAGAADRSR